MAGTAILAANHGKNRLNLPSVPQKAINVSRAAAGPSGGDHPFHRKRAAPDHFGINVFCLADFENSAFPVRATEGVGMSIADREARPEWHGPRQIGANPA
jgi:hypothetical protein